MLRNIGRYRRRLDDLTARLAPPRPIVAKLRRLGPLTEREKHVVPACAVARVVDGSVHAGSFRTLA